MSTLRIDLDRREALRSFALLTGLVFASLISGWLIAHGQAKYLAALGAVIAMAVLAVKAHWLLVSLLVLAVLDGIPGANVQDLHVAGAFNPITVAALLLVALGAARLAGTRLAQDGPRWWRLPPKWSLCFVGLWCVGLIRGIAHGVPILKAATFEQAFLLFGLLLPVSAFLLSDRREIRRFLTTVAAVTLLYAVGEIAVTLGLIPPSAINVSYTAAFGSVTRVYAPMQDAVVLLFCISVGVLLVERGRLRRLAAASALITGAAVLLGLTRAEYLGLSTSVLITLALTPFLAPARIRGRIGVRFGVAVAAVALAVVLLAALLPGSTQTGLLHQVASRANSALAAVSGSATGPTTVSYREGVDKAMLGVLGGKWAFGLGFLPPSSVYFPQLPGGTIANSDVGVFNSLMTIGLVGTMLLYLPIVVFLVRIAQGLAKDDGQTAWRVGLTIWALTVLGTSVTLYTLFSTGGLVMVAMVIGVGNSLSTAGDRALRRSQPARPLAEF